ncbi:hypothetical protein, partial [Dysgonomonas sp. 511]|uniref:hypothetical protein n=1 Tax=Dysgonomonas sp. 511 TaxID=2302930 RepID=UPI0013D1D46F
MPRTRPTCFSPPPISSSKWDGTTAPSYSAMAAWQPLVNGKRYAKGCEFSAENVSPTMMSDGMMHYKYTDIPMNE